MEKDPGYFRKHPEQHFLRPDSKFFLEFLKKIFFAIIVTFKMTIKNYFFVKKTCQKNLPAKFVDNFFQIRMASRCMLSTMKSMCHNICFNEKRPGLLQETSGTMFFKAQFKNFFGISKFFLFTIFVTFKMTLQNYFFVKKTCQKNFPAKLAKKRCKR